MEGGGVGEVLLRAGEEGGGLIFISYGKPGQGLFLLDICVYGCIYLVSRNVYTSFHLFIIHYLTSGACKVSLALKGMNL